jgi:tRNA A37 methylthiotransferase MiaB
MKNQIDPRIKKVRTNTAMRISSELADEYRSQWIGRIADVITEETEDGYTKGYTSEYIPVKIFGELPRGILAKVRLERYADQVMYGEVIENETD